MKGKGRAGSPPIPPSVFSLVRGIFLKQQEGELSLSACCEKTELITQFEASILGSKAN